MRYRFYREHKYVTYRLYELEQFIAKIDFTDSMQVFALKEQLNSLEALMKGHAEHEDRNLHELLRQKGCYVYEAIEADHRQHEEYYQTLISKLIKIETTKNSADKLLLGYDFYLSYRVFVCENLRHLHEEETVIMQELLKLYSDGELKQVDFNTYAHMTPTEMVQMLETLISHMNPNDHEFFLQDMHDAQPEKFLIVWKEIASKFSSAERNFFAKKFQL